MAWHWPRRQQRNISVSDPVLAEYFTVGSPNYAGVQVGESSALGLSAVWRACSLISGTLASLPLRTLRDVDGTRTRVSSFLDEPGGPDGPTSFEWTETLLLHLLLHGNAYLAHVFNGAGALTALVAIHPLAVSVELAPSAPGGKLFTVTLVDGTRKEFDATTMTQIASMSVDGVKGLSVIAAARNSIGTAIAGDRAAAKMFASGALHSGIVTAEEDITEDEAKVIKDSLNAKTAGWENAGEIAVINRKLKFTPWTMSLEDAQFLQSRQFQIEEVARWFGVPPYELMQTEKQTSWGTGIEAQQRGLARQVLGPWANRVEQRLSRLLPGPRFVEFDFAGLERPTPAEEIDLLIKQVQGGLLTVNEARHIRNLPPVDGGDVLAGPATPASEPAEVPA
jgi:HK97 family phage portal protein